MKFLIIDNYDSFVYNIAQRLGELGINSDVVRNDKITVNEIKKRNNVKIIKALTIETGKDVLKYKKYEAVSDITLFDSIGREKSLSFDHSLLKDVPKNVIKMIAGNIQVQDLEKISKIADIVDVSGAVETEKKKDLTKIKEFLLKIKEINELN